MSQKTDSQLGVLSQQVADETAPGANTAERVGNLFQDFVDSKVNNDSLPKVYSVRLTQSGTGDPSGTASANTTGATVVLARTIAGYSSVTFSSAVLTAGKTIVQLSGRGSGGYTDPKLFSVQQASTTVINIGAFRASDQTAEDDWVLDLTVTIYP